MTTLIHENSAATKSPQRQQSAQSVVGAVVIGRNEGQRLIAGLKSLIGTVQHIVYVDSGSTDGSTDAARDMGVHVVDLDLSVKFTAARARNEGIAALQELDANVQFVQVIDGDCAVADGWIDAALEAIQQDATIGIVCGRRRERYPDATKYNQLCDMEWDGKPGPVDYCGGDALIRLDAFRSVNGYNPSLIAGEEPEMCVRLRSGGWIIQRIDHDMTWHDAALTKFSQWWQRARRAGHAYAQGYAMHGRGPDQFRKRDIRSICVWGGAIPAMAILTAPFTFGLTLVFAMAGYVRLYSKIRRYRESFGNTPAESRLYARYCVLGKLPQFLGTLNFYWNRLRGKQSLLIEYK